jgi:hypothetical protein
MAPPETWEDAPTDGSLKDVTCTGINLWPPPPGP